MVDRPTRLAQFITDRTPEPGVEVQVLCEDNRGTYTPPFLCRWAEGRWASVATSEPIDAEVIGWRLPPETTGPNRPFWAHRLSALRARH